MHSLLTQLHLLALNFPPWLQFVPCHWKTFLGGNINTCIYSMEQYLTHGNVSIYTLAFSDLNEKNIVWKNVNIEQFTGSLAHTIQDKMLPRIEM